MKVAIVYDRVNKFGGAERVLTNLHHIYPDAPLFTLVYNEETSPWSKGFKVVPTFFNQIAFLKKRHELLAPLAPLAFETFDLAGFDLVISVTSSDAKTVITRPETLHLCYCLTPNRYLWSGVDEYRSQFPLPYLFDIYLRHARENDLIYANRPDIYIAISNEVKKRIAQYYQKPSEVIYPPINYTYFSKTHQHKREDYYLVVNRLVPYKKTDIVIEAFNKLNKRLIVAGTGSEETRLRKMAKDNIEFAGFVTDEKLRHLYAGARALIFPQVEDFGLTPLEAAAAGTPTLCFKAGGALETVIDKHTGLYFDEQTPESVVAAVNRFEGGHHQIGAKHCREQAAIFSEDGFRTDFSVKVNLLWEKHRKMFMP